MASKPTDNGEINDEPQSQPEMSELQQPRQPQQSTVQIPRAPSSHSQRSNRSNRISPGTTESQLPPTRPHPAVSFPNPRDTSAATLGLLERPDTDYPSPTYHPADGRTSRYYSTTRMPNGEHTNNRRRASDARRSTLVPSDECLFLPVKDRLESTLTLAKAERKKAFINAGIARYSMYAVAGAQVLLGAMTTGLSALRLNGQSSAAATTALGILTTLSGSYLAHVRATAEPETSLLRMQRLDAYIRKLDAFILDNGLDTTNRFKDRIEHFRNEFEDILADASASKSLTGPTSPVEDKTKLMSKDSFV